LRVRGCDFEGLGSLSAFGRCDFEGGIGLASGDLGILERAGRGKPEIGDDGAAAIGEEHDGGKKGSHRGPTPGPFDELFDAAGGASRNRQSVAEAAQVVGQLRGAGRSALEALFRDTSRQSSPSRAGILAAGASATPVRCRAPAGNVARAVWPTNGASTGQEFVQDRAEGRRRRSSGRLVRADLDLFGAHVARVPRRSPGARSALAVVAQPFCQPKSVILEKMPPRE